jgi:hypothetical protein
VVDPAIPVRRRHRHMMTCDKWFWGGQVPGLTPAGNGQPFTVGISHQRLLGGAPQWLDQ